MEGALIQADLDQDEGNVVSDFFAQNTEFLADPLLRERMARNLANAVNANVRVSPFQGTVESGRRTEELRRVGYCGLGPLLTRDQIAETIDYLRDRPCFNSELYHQSDRRERYIGRDAEHCRLAGYRIADVARAPHLLEAANHPEVLSVVASYMECMPTMTLLSCWWSFPQADGTLPFPQIFHRDFDDYRFCTLFIYLTDVGPDNGPHQYIRHSHDPEMLARVVAERSPPGRDAPTLWGDHGIGRCQEYLDLLGDVSDVIVGRAGTAFIGNNYGLHRGTPPTAGPRLLFAVRFGMFRNANEVHRRREGHVRVPRAEYDGRVPDTPEHRYLNRLILEP